MQVFNTDGTDADTLKSLRKALRRAKDKSFNASTDLILDPDLPKINIVRQDVGRVGLECQVP